jgi:hypothetical protein
LFVPAVIAVGIDAQIYVPSGTNRHLLADIAAKTPKLNAGVSSAIPFPAAPNCFRSNPTVGTDAIHEFPSPDVELTQDPPSLVLPFAAQVPTAGDQNNGPDRTVDEKLSRQTPVGYRDVGAAARTAFVATCGVLVVVTAPCTKDVEAHLLVLSPGDAVKQVTF